MVQFQRIGATSLVVAVGIACLAPAASGQRVAIAAAGQTFGFPERCEWQDVREKLDSFDVFETVDLLDVIGDTPTIETLLNYDAILTYTNGSYLDPFLLGDNLADYVDAGGGVVVAVFANSSTSFARSLEGRWTTGGYEVIVPRTGFVFEGGVLGRVLEPEHPLMDGVDTFADPFGGKPLITELTPGSRDIALWDDERTLIAVGPTDRRVDLGFYPPSSDCERGGWDPSSDGARIIFNAMRFVASADSCYADCDGSGQLDFFDFLCFQNLFSAGDPGADCDGSGALDFFDFLCFQNEFAAGCP